jgi:hypothetical protein
MRLLTATFLTTLIATSLPTPGALSTAHAAAGPLSRATRALTSREVTLPAGTVIPITFDASVGSDISRVEQAVRAHVTRPIVINGATAIPAGSRVDGVVTSARRSGKVKGRAYVAVRFNEIAAADGERHRINTRTIGRTAPATKKQDAMKIGLPAAGGAAVGAIVGGKKGAAIGAAAGGGVGTAVVLDTRGKEVRFARGTRTSVRLTQPLTIWVPR